MWRDYWIVCKPRVVFLMLITAWAGMFLALPPYTFPWFQIMAGTAGIACLAASGAVFNHWADHKIDAHMKRTAHRPLPCGRLTPGRVLGFASLLLLLGSVTLLQINLLVWLLTLASCVGYAFFYTLFLKPRTPQNIVIGGITGATPPLLGWLCIHGTCDPFALLLVLIIFLWTPPHFWALALARKEDYARSGWPMLPVTHGTPFTTLNILLYAILLWLATLMPYLIGHSGGLYLLISTVLNVRFIVLCMRLHAHPSKEQAMVVFHDSISYLMLLFVALMLDSFYFYWIM